MAFKKYPQKRDTFPSCPYDDDFITDIDELPSKAEILYMTLGYTMRFPLTIPVTMSTLCCMPPGAAKLDFNGHCFNKVTVVGVVCWNMKLSNHVEYYLYDPNDKSQTYFNVIQCPLFHKQYPHCYPMGTYVAATGFLVGTTDSTLMMGNVKPITERQYNEYVFQARVAKFQCAVDVVPKPLLRDDDLFKVSTNCTIEQVRRQITFQLLAERPSMAKELVNPVKFKETSDSVFNYFRLCGQKPWKPVCLFQNQHSTKPNGTPKTADDTPETADGTPDTADGTLNPADGTLNPADGTPETADGNETASQNHSILKNVNATVFSLPYEHIRLCDQKPGIPALDLLNQLFTKPNGTPDTADGTPETADGTPKPADGTVNPADGTVNPADGTPNPADGTVNPADGTVNPADGTPNPADGTVNPADGTPKPADGTPEPADGTPETADGNETASQNHSILKNVNATVFSLPYEHIRLCDQKPGIPALDLLNQLFTKPNGTPETADDTPKPADGTPDTADGTPETADGTPKPADGTVNPADGTVNPADGTPNPADGTVNPADGTPKPADGTPETADGTPKPADITLNPADGTPETADSNETASQNHSILKYVNATVCFQPYEHIRLCGQKPWIPVELLLNQSSTKPNGTPKPADDGTPKPADGTPKPADGTPEPADGTPETADGNETASQAHLTLNKANATVFSLPFKHNKACKAYTSEIDNYTKLVDYFLDVDIMKLNLAVSFYNNHVPVTVDTLNALPKKDKFNWGGLTFKTVRVIGKVVSKTIEGDEIHYVLEDLQTSAQYSVLQYISEDGMFPAPITYHVGAFVEVVGDLHARTKKRNHDAVIADLVRRVKEKCPFVQKFIDNAAFVREYDDETIQIILLAMSFTDYCRNGMPPSKFPLSVTFDLIEQFDLDTVIPVDMSGVFGHISPESCLFGLFERVYEDFYYLS